MTKLVYIAIFGIVALVIIVTVYNRNNQSNAYANCVHLANTVYTNEMNSAGSKTYISGTARLYLYNQAQSEYTNSLNDCKQFTHQ